LKKQPEKWHNNGSSETSCHFKNNPILKALSYSFLFIFLLIASASFAQQVTGQWYGVGNVVWSGEHSSYLSELVLTQKGSKVTGEFSYFFRSAAVKTKVSGTFDAKTRTLELTVRPVLNYQAKDINGADCPMEGSFTLRTSRVESTLTGQFNPTYNYRYTCPAINIKFKKETPADKTDTTRKKLLEQPVELDLPIEKLLKETTPIIVQDTNTPTLIEALVKRSFDAGPVIDVDSDSLKISLYDNGDVDNDTITLFYNRKPITDKIMLSAQAFSVTIPVDTSINEMSMYAENLGRIPPNTALAVIYDGEKRYELYMTSNFIKNATIRFRKKVKK
jgi:hypothetical protein